MYNEEAWVVLDYFVGIYCGMAVITRATKTQLITKNGRRFRKPKELTDGAMLDKVGGNDHHSFKLRKIIIRKKEDPVKK